MAPERESKEVSLSALEALYRQLYPQYLRVAVGLLGNRESAHDAVQETFARAIRSRSALRDPQSVPVWLWRTLTNVCLDDRRSSAGQGSLSFGVDEDANGRLQDWPEVRAAIAALPARQRAAIFLRHYADLDYETIAEILEIRRGTVAATLHAAHAQLRETLMEVAER
jgi:RNA polymerase sigma-70 factor (ECF subfamily)